MNVAWSKSIKQGDMELFTFYAIFFKNIMRKMAFEAIGRNCFNPRASKSISQHNLEVWPGFYSAMQKLECGPLIMIDLTNKVIRKDSVLSHIQDLESKGKSREFINEQLKWAIVVTTYGQNKKTYRVDHIDFERSPATTFKCRSLNQKKQANENDVDEEEKDMSFLQYYRLRYSVDIREEGQPLLISKNERTGAEICLIPELCQMTGLTDSHRANFNLMKDLSQILHKSPHDRKNESIKLVQEMQQQEKVKQLIKQWGLEFDTNPYVVEGQRIQGGNIMMGVKGEGGQRN